MSSIELENLVAQLKASAPDLSREASAVRYDFSAMMRNLPLDEELVQEAQVINGVPCISAHGAWSDPERVLLYLHGGATFSVRPWIICPWPPTLPKLVVPDCIQWTIDSRLNIPTLPPLMMRLRSIGVC